MPPNPDNPFGSYIRDAREVAGMSLSEAAELVGCTKTHLWKLERGTANNPTIKIIAGIASAYEKDVGELAALAAAGVPGSEYRLAASNVVSAKRRLEEVKARG